MVDEEDPEEEDQLVNEQEQIVTYSIRGQV